MRFAPAGSQLIEGYAALPLSRSTLIFVDVETTGLDSRRVDRVCEIALIRREPSGQTYEWSQLIDPQRPISRGAYAVNRISASMLKGAPRFGALIPELNEVCEGGIWVAHNAPFDLGFLRSEYRSARKTFIERPVIDTVMLSRRHFRFPSYRLEELSRRFGMVNSAAHRALGDCRATLHVFDSVVTSIFREREPTIAELAVHPDRMLPGGDPWKMLPPTLGQMLKASKELEITYVAGNGLRSERRITVREVISRSRDLYLVAHCHSRNDDRHFRLDRILDWKPARNGSA